ncbi:hypothetical protein Fcan01_15860 [Folsomia candida]|uniref:Uncharacterized protein n=1 Tax=Folsomia candida TaxID=158441 RepID=A0A226DYQ4_FOLCA|nr:hypothetical protein Fcan01_15860 [Folsomia candida]
MEALPPKHIPLFRTNFYSNLQQYSKTSSNLNSTLLPLDNNDTYHHHISFDTSLGLLTILSSISRMHILYAVDHFMLTAAMGLWVPCRYFGNVLITRQDLVLPQVLEIYGDLKVLSDLLNEAFDRLVTPHLVAILLYYSTHVMDLVSHESTMDRILLLACTVINAGTLYFAAESCLYVGGPSMLYWVETLKKWISNKLNQSDATFVKDQSASTISPLIAMQIKQELADYPVRLSGRGMFVMNYSLVISSEVQACNTFSFLKTLPALLKA